MAEYNFREIEKKWQEKWKDQGTYSAEIDPLRPKFIPWTCSLIHPELGCMWVIL